jgi:hypothetical protein
LVFQRRGPSARCIRSGFRLRAPAALTPAKRLKFDPRWRYHVLQLVFQARRSFGSLHSLRISPAVSRCAHARKAAQVRSPMALPRLSLVFQAQRSFGSLRSLRISPAAPAALRRPQSGSSSIPDGATTPLVGFSGAEVLRLAALAQDFACGLPLRSRPQSGSSSIPDGATTSSILKAPGSPQPECDCYFIRDG